MHGYTAGGEGAGKGANPPPTLIPDQTDPNELHTHGQFDVSKFSGRNYSAHALPHLPPSHRLLFRSHISLLTPRSNMGSKYLPKQDNTINPPKTRALENSRWGNEPEKGQA